MIMRRVGAFAGGLPGSLAQASRFRFVGQTK